MKKSIVKARGPALKGELALVKVRALMEANLVGRTLIDNEHFLRTLGYAPESFALTKCRRVPRARSLH